MKSSKFRPLLKISLLLASAYAVPGFAQQRAVGGGSPNDPVIQLLKTAHTSYTKKDYAAASADLGKAQKLIDELRSNLGGVLLVDIAGWEGSKPEKVDATAAGNGRVLKRTYLSSGKQVGAEIIMDSPLVEKLAPLLTNEFVAKGAGFSKERIDGREALVKTSPKDKSSELNVWLGNGVLFKLTGNAEVPPAELAALARKFDLKAMDGLKKEAAEK